jgi:tetratricopeptide (TPR) repeat protein
MTYSLIPPILIVLSLIGIILFLMRKSPQMARIERERPIRSVINMEGESTGQVVERGNSLSHRSLLILEKLTRRFKIMLLRWENKFASWNESIKQKRGQMIENQVNQEVSEISESQETENHVPVPAKLENDVLAKAPEIRRRTVLSEVREKNVRPMVSEKIVAPKRTLIRAKLERVLIDRIASNPKDIEAYERLGEYYFEIGQLDHSKECFKQVIRLDSNSSNAKAKMRRLETLLRR